MQETDCAYAVKNRDYLFNVLTGYFSLFFFLFCLFCFVFHSVHNNFLLNFFSGTELLNSVEILTNLHFVVKISCFVDQKFCCCETKNFLKYFCLNKRYGSNFVV